MAQAAGSKSPLGGIGVGKKLYRSRTNRVIAGVCGGIGEYLDVDPVVIRLLFVLVTLFAGTGILFYLIAWILIPEKPGA